MTKAQAWTRQKLLQAEDRIPTHEQMENRITSIPNQRDRYFMALMYLTAGRVSEVIGVKREDFTKIYKDGREILVVRMKNEKNRKRHKKDIPITLDREAVLGTLIEQYMGQKQGNNLLGFGTRARGWQIATKYGFNPHFIRHIRLTHLVTVYDFNDQLLMRYAGWTSPKEAKHYMELRWYDFLDKM